MQLITWNLNGLEDKHLDVRTEAAMFQILLGAPIEDAMIEGFKPNVPDIVLLQEVVERTFHAHLKPHLKAAGFHIYPHEPTERSYFEVIAVRSPILESSYIPFEYSDQGRGLSIVKIDGLTIMTAHMESMKPGKSMRIDQATQIIAQMNQTQPCIFGGDTNLRKAEWQSLNTKNINDAWQSVGSPKAHRMTWEQNQYKSRYDRIWTKNLEIKSFETFGTKLINGMDVRPSDHRGIRVSISEKPSQK